MAAWRRKALEALPELRRELNDKREIDSSYALWVEVLPLTRAAHEAGDQPRLDRIYDFALWCYRQGSRELRNSAAVGFHEHLLPSLPGEAVSEMLKRLPDDLVTDVWGLWEAITPEKRMQDARLALRAQKRPVPPSAPDR